MDEKERYRRESQAKGGSVPPDKRRKQEHRSESAKESFIQESFNKKEQSEANRRINAEEPEVEY